MTDGMTDSKPSAQAVQDREHEPWLAVNLSKLLPGLGQIYNGRWRRGLVLIALTVGLALLSVFWLISPLPRGLVYSLGSFGLLLLLSLWNAVDAYRLTPDRYPGKDPWLAVFLTTLVVGLGQLYVRKFWLGALLLGVAIASFALPLLRLLLWLLVPLAAWLAYRATPTHRPFPKTGKAAGLVVLVTLILPLGLSLPAAWALRHGVMEARSIASASMQPTLQVGDRLVVNKLVYRWRSPQRGDIVLFDAPPVLQQSRIEGTLIGRVIGLPGDRLEVKPGKVLLNGQPLAEAYILEPPDYAWGPETVPPNSYAVLGDNRNNAYDSHYWGFVSRSLIRGQATQRFWPLSRWGLLAVEAPRASGQR